MSSSTTAFENKPCTRCGGSGHYSYCYSHGTRCFGCGGRGWQFTKRGAAAQRFYADSLKVPATEVQPGQKIRIDGVPGIAATRWLLVTAVELDGERAKISGMSRKPGVSTWDDPAMLEAYGLSGPASDLVRVEQSGDEKRAKVQQALEYQATLTAKGEPNKRLARHAASLAELDQEGA